MPIQDHDKTCPVESRENGKTVWTYKNGSTVTVDAKGDAVFRAPPGWKPFEDD